MSKLDRLAQSIAAARPGTAATLAQRAVDPAPAVTVTTLPAVTASKAKWGSLIPAILGAATAVPVANAVLPDHIAAGMDFWQYLIWTVAQAAIFGGLTFLNIWASPPNETINGG